MYAQTDVLPEGETAFVQAMAIERSGDLDRAIKIYYQILTGDPNHQRAYLQLRNIYTRTGDSESAIPIIENWLKYHPEDLQSEYRLLFHSYVRFGQTNAMESLAQEGRERFDEPHLFAIDLANYYQSRQTYDRSIREYLTLIRYQKQYLRYTTDRILIMSDDTTSHTLIDSTLRMESEKNQDVQIILAGFYYKTGHFENALLQHIEIGVINSDDIRRWLEFSANLIEEKQYELSVRSYHHLLENMEETDPRIIGDVLLGLGQAYGKKLNCNL